MLCKTMQARGDIWVQADERETGRRNLARVGQPGGPPTVRHLRD